MSKTRTSFSCAPQKLKAESKKFETGFTIVKDYRFKESEGIYWPLRVELLPTKDRKRNTIGYYVKKNEFGGREWYPHFYQRIKNKNCAYETYEEILEINNRGIWKEHPIKTQYNNGKQISIPLRLNLTNKNGKRWEIRKLLPERL